MLNPIYLMTCGSVDDGKSTLLGSIMYSTKNIPEDVVQKINNLNEKIDYSKFLDGLLDEQTQGITIDLAYKYLKIKNKNFVFVDSPGHQEYTKNTANAATFADVAIILVDVKNGITSQTIKHLEIISYFQNVKKFIFCINKMDLVNFSEKKFEDIKNKLVEKVNKIGLSNDICHYIPTSAINGDNIIFKSKNTKFYNGKHLLDLILSLKISEKNSPKSNTLITINNVIRDQKFKRIYSAKLFGSTAKSAEEYINLRTMQKTKIKNLYKNLKSQNEIKDGESFNLTTTKQIDIISGDVLVRNKKNIYFTDSVKSKFIKVSNDNLILSKRYLFQFQSFRVYGFISKISKPNSELLTITLEFENPVPISPEKFYKELSHFLCIDFHSSETIGFGSTLYSLDRGVNIIRQDLIRNDNEGFLKKCIWFTGLPSSGKTTLANSLGEYFKSINKPFYIIDGDNFRKTISKDLGFSVEDRVENNRRMAHVSRILYDSNVIPIVASISPSNASRDYARSLFPENDFIEIYVNTSIENCKKRDAKNLYKNQKKLRNLTGVSSNYEQPINPDIIINTENNTVAQSTNFLLEKLFKST